jgi:hypothetical protein
MPRPGASPTRLCNSQDKWDNGGIREGRDRNVDRWNSGENGGRNSGGREDRQSEIYWNGNYSLDYACMQCEEARDWKKSKKEVAMGYSCRNADPRYTGLDNNTSGGPTATQVLSCLQRMNEMAGKKENLYSKGKISLF